MKAKDVMTLNVITVDENTSVEDIAAILLKWRISAVPVVDSKERLVGIVSEGDLIHRSEPDADRLPPWWLSTLAKPDALASAYLKSHGRLAKDVMTKDVVTVDEETSVTDIARMLEEHRIKRVPVTRRSKLVGIVSRANLIHGLATSSVQPFTPGTDDRRIRASILNELRSEPGVWLESLNVTVGDGVVHLWGTAVSGAQKDAIRVIAERTPGVSAVEDHLNILPEMFRHWLSVKD